jgi:hypothetical protein
MRRIFREIGVHEEERDAADPEVPDAQVAEAIREGNGDVHGFSRGRAGEPHGKVFDFIELVMFLLPAFVIEFLFEVSLVVEETDAAEIETDIRGCLEVVAGEDTEATAVELDAFVESELE